jgi:hypothetical protein
VLLLAVEPPLNCYQPRLPQQPSTNVAPSLSCFIATEIRLKIPNSFNVRSYFGVMIFVEEVPPACAIAQAPQRWPSETLIDNDGVSAWVAGVRTRGLAMG